MMERRRVAMMRRALLGLLILLLVASTVNLVSAVLLYFPPHGLPPIRPSPLLSGALAAERGWPAPTPHSTTWPKPDYWSVQRTPGRSFVHAAASLGTPQFQFAMQASQMGWPLPVIQHTQQWWPWEDPAWKMNPNIQDAGISLVWRGALLNPLVYALPPWLAVVVPLAVWKYVRRRRRLAARQCLKCGYPIGVAERCTECGAALPREFRPGAVPTAS